MTDSMNTKELETLSYKPKTKESVECHSTMTGRECIGCEIDTAGKCHLAKPEQPKSVKRGFMGLGCNKPEQPNQQLMLIQTIQNLMTCVNNNLSKLRESTHFAPVGKRAILVAKALEEINTFEKTTLYELQKEYE